MPLTECYGVKSGGVGGGRGGEEVVVAGSGGEWRNCVGDEVSVRLAKWEQAAAPPL